MNKILFILCMLFSTCAVAANAPIFKWQMNANLGSGITLKSTVPLSQAQINLMKSTFDSAEEKFFEYFDVSRDICQYGPLEIRVMSNYEILNDKKYFPNLDPESYAKSNEVIFGRYYRDENILYIIAPHSYIYDWKNNFAHELVHYFLDDCGRVIHGEKLLNNKTEHEYVEKFLSTYRAVFPGS